MRPGRWDCSELGAIPQRAWSERKAMLVSAAVPDFPQASLLGSLVLSAYRCKTCDVFTQMHDPV